MLFPMPEDVNRAWGLVAEGTGNGELGMAAKVATDGGAGDRVSRLICVYTVDFGDRQDVRRVLQGLVERGLVKKKDMLAEERVVYYKCGKY